MITARGWQFKARLLPVAILVILVGCKRTSTRTITFHDLKLTLGPTLHSQRSANELIIWDEVKSAGYVKINKFDIGPEYGDMSWVVYRSFDDQAKYLDKALVGAKFLGPPVLFKK